MANARLGWFSPLGVAASIRASARRVGLRAHRFRFSACPASEWPLGEFVLPPSASEIALGGLILPLGGLAFGLTASAFRHAPLRSGRWASSFFRLPLRRFRSASWPSDSLLPLFGTRRFGDCPRRVGSSAQRVALRAHCFRFSARAASEWPLGRLVFGLIASAFRHAPLRSGCWASSFFRLPLRKLPSAGWPSGSLLPLFGMRRFGNCRSAGWSSGSLLPLFGMRRFGVAAGRVRSSAFRFGNCPQRVGLRAHGFRFSARTASELPSAG